MMKINNILNNLYYCILALVPTGWLLNWYYYYARFMSEGFEWIGLVISIALVIFASYMFACSQYFRQKEKPWKLFFIAYCVLAVYSINCTAAGQYWDQQKKNQETNTEKIDKENNSYWISRYKEDIEDSKEEIERLKEIRNKSIDNLSDMYYYKNTGKTVKELINEEYEKIKNADMELKKLTDENKVSAKNQDDIKMSKTLYIFYRIAFNMPEGGEEAIQFIFQILLSIIIESIAQLSLFAFMKIRFLNEKKEIAIITKPKIYAPVKITQIELRHFSVIAWAGINKKQSKTITNRTTFMNIIKNVCPDFTEDKYKLIMRKAIEKGLIKKEKMGYFPASEFVNQEYFYNKMCEFMNFT